MELTYCREFYPDIGPDEFIDVLVRSTLALRRPVDQPETTRGMLEHADVIITARDQGRLVGISARLPISASASTWPIWPSIKPIRVRESARNCCNEPTRRPGRIP